MEYDQITVIGAHVRPGDRIYVPTAPNEWVKVLNCHFRPGGPALNQHDHFELDLEGPPHVTHKYLIRLDSTITVRRPYMPKTATINR
jgi:hypothetical protein